MEHKIKVKTNAGHGMLTLMQSGRHFNVVSLQVLGQGTVAFGFREKPGAVSLDETSDCRQCFGIATRVKVGTTILDVHQMRAVCVEDILSALNCVTIACYNPEEI